MNEQLETLALRIYKEEVLESGYHPIRPVRMFSNFLAALPKQMPVSKQELFNAISAATDIVSDGMLGISVKEFTKSIGPLYKASEIPLPDIVCGVCEGETTITDTEGCEWPCYQCNPQPQNNQLLVNAARYQWIMCNQREAVEVIEQMGICKLEQHIDDDIARMKNGNQYTTV